MTQESIELRLARLSKRLETGDPSAEKELERIRSRLPGHELIGDAEKLLEAIANLEAHISEMTAGFRRASEEQNRRFRESRNLFAELVRSHSRPRDRRPRTSTGLPGRAEPWAKGPVGRRPKRQHALCPAAW